MTFRTGSLTDVLNDEHYRGRLQLFNNISPGNLSLFISDLTEEDQGNYRCSTEKGLRDITIYVKDCDLSGDNYQVFNGHPGGSVLLPCSCSDLNTKPQTFTWMTFRTGSLTDVLNDEHYRGRLQLFNNISPGNLSLFISDLREEDQGVYRCSTEKGLRDITIYVKGCDLSGDNYQVFNGHPGGSVLLPCSCSDLNTKPQTFTWMTYRTGSLTDVLNDEHYRGRLQLFNNISPGNLSLFISDLREEDQGDYRCSTGFWEYRDIRINVEVGRRETSTHSGKTDRRPPSEQPPSKTTNSPPSSSSTTLEQGTCGENGITEGRQDCKGKPTDQVSTRTMSYNRSVSTFRAFVVFVIHCR
ncbi:polymeric immunoglobulin receptor-like isoform X3 [Hemibagrus wyckioides]|uniref:polymeric immunoglobulin receptor-like isoform X3 n=1 Tax=Hemibagrus wyckioides TaxID=337641 RepID=UPI00266BDB2B|nr:polymeric immunoglobulin receptor-like isoform X3 [Hemibagrus wyckioides]